ncbi:carbon-nitrogen hydrolase family protein [Aneurinibacillus aneurinilyticus]|uniref:Carbon-nitrogen hydrolase family protein n=2 Tax=Aneurinibacillus aneurinilyticus TaxID=1391 RepID=A0A848D1U2_ANEAE|nr:carbon-nitrogen hydrolase family protein [Aneurinibacillus aneurinilyticus]ERI09839.1 hydrolase, carbon-nitrogen family [Aneurinibacillus aneurinilyticus ATCC 12856]MED0672867.1 carbon-nitrogen hydrolase family protein [Aneurinibacillus aneurinilyticus]MED0708006.1 carbon-nitrogen hydrolase family protein [Aneurinibacillus aneurinilyticus]MED0722169.1 carbon-nitrogen hydrolase family protein [Aneurinibacillus aneurinilyticus]MED0734329.1 carbon-nitrogen hydrolase family protein [Aneurinibac
MTTQQHHVRVAVVQAASIIMEREASTEKAVSLTLQAAEKGARLVVFPEAFIPAYPRGLSFGTKIGSRAPEGRKDWLRYWENAVPVPSETTERLGEAARQAGVYLVIGVIERDNECSGGTVYCTVLFFGPDGTLLGKHRKLKPTASERIVWGEGDGSTLPVFDTPFGKIGSLICWENYMPLARMAMYAKGVQIYIAPTADARDVWQSTIRHIAVEGRCFVLSCNQYVTKDMYPNDLACYDELASSPHEMSSGGSAVVGPLGDYIVEPVFGREDMLIADLDIRDVAYSQLDFDVVGHYARPDVFQLLVNEEKKESVKWLKPTPFA